MGKLHSGKGTSGSDSECDHAWASFCDRAIHDRERYDHGVDSCDNVRYDSRERGCFDRNFYSHGGHDYDNWGGRSYDNRGGRDYGHDYNCLGRDYGHDYDRRGRDAEHGGRDLRSFDRCEPHRLPKISFSSFDGESDPLTWLNKCDNFFRGHRTPEDEKVWMASLHLDDTVVEWYYQMERDFGMVPWSRFVDFINLRFGCPSAPTPSSRSRPCFARGWWRSTQGATSLCSCVATTYPYAPRSICTLVVWASSWPLTWRCSIRRTCNKP